VAGTATSERRAKLPRRACQGVPQTVGGLTHHTDPLFFWSTVAMPFLPVKFLGAIIHKARLPASKCVPLAVSCGPPPQLPLAQIFGRPRLRYAVDTVLRYRCRDGLAQRNLPLIRCQENGLWEAPQISCVPRRPVSDRRKQVGGTSYLAALGSKTHYACHSLTELGVTTASR
jgi:hypothetical protein